MSADDALAAKSDGSQTPAAEPGLTAVRYEHTNSFTGLLDQLNVSLLVTTYQAGKLVAIGTHQGAVSISFHNFEQVMGLALVPDGVAVGAKRQVWYLRSAPDLAERIAPAGKHDACFLTRSAHFTGPVHGHELAWGDGKLWQVNTLFSCLSSLREDFSFVPHWRPPFVTDWAAEDRCHLNGLAMEEGKPRYVTTLAETNSPAGWRPNKDKTGCIYDVKENQRIVGGLCMPHSPRLVNGRLWVLNSGRGELSVVDSTSKTVVPVAGLAGYTRGVDFFGRFAFVGLSRIRETAVFGGLPIAEHWRDLQCGVAVVDCHSGRQVAAFRFHSGVEEIFEVKVLPGFRCPIISGPLPDVDGTDNIWLVPQPQPLS